MYTVYWTNIVCAGITAYTNGMPKGFYDGYTEEIHEVFVFDIFQ